MDSLLFGHNSEERIVAIQQIDDKTMRLFKRVEGKILQSDAEFFPFILLSRPALIDGFTKKYWIKKTEGQNFYNHIVAFSKWSDMWDGVHYILKNYNKINNTHAHSYHDVKDILVRNDAVHQFMLQSNITLFKGMEFDDLVRIQIDVQCINIYHNKTKLVSEKIAVLTITVSDNREFVFNAHKKNESDILEKFIQKVIDINPDVIEGYELFDKILPMLCNACERNNIPFAIGRDGSIVKNNHSYGHTDTDLLYSVYGRHLVDIKNIAEAENIFKDNKKIRDIYELAKTLSVFYEDNFINNFKNITDAWNNDYKLVENASLKKARLVKNISNILSPKLFYSAQIFPFCYRTLKHISPIARLDALMLREYIQKKHSVPKPQDKTKSVSLPSEIFYAGVYDNILHLKIEGLHSSIIINNHINPFSDKLNIFNQLITYFLNSYKELQNIQVHNIFSASLITAKLNVLNEITKSFHIYLGSSKCLFNDIEQAEVVNRLSLELMKHTLHQLELYNAKVILHDNESYFAQTPENIKGEININNFINRLSNALPEGVNIILFNRYVSILSYKKNNYAVLDYNNNLTVKGAKLLSLDKEKYLIVFVKRFIECLLTKDYNRMHHSFATAYTQVVQRKWNIFDFYKSEVAKTDSETYQQQIKDKIISTSYAMEAAINASKYIKKNERIDYYISGKSVDSIVPKLAEEWNYNIPDENTQYYLNRLYETAGKFKIFFDAATYERIINMNNIFSFSAEGIDIVNQKIGASKEDDISNDDGFSIWLAENE